MHETRGEDIIEGLQSLNSETRAASAKQLNVLCEILGREKTANELVEFLHDLNEEDSLVLLEMSNHLLFLINFLPDINECAPLFEFLLTFLINYEKRVHFNGYKAFKCFVKNCKTDILTNVICPKIFQLAKSESDNYKIGVSRIIPCIIKKCVYENQTKHVRIFIHLFLDLCQDACVLVKKNCCDQFCKFLKAIKLYNILAINKKNLSSGKEKSKERGENEVTERDGNEKEKKEEGHEKIVKEEEEDDDDDDLNEEEKEEKQDMGIEIEIDHEKTMKNEEKEDKLFLQKIWRKSKEIYNSFFYPINGLDEVQTSAIRILSDILEMDPYYIADVKTFLTNLCNDESWRVRAVLANNIHKILKSIQSVNTNLHKKKGKQTDPSDLSIIVLLLLKDLDSNVRSIVLDNLDKIFLCTNIETSIIEEIYEDLKRDIDSNNLHLKISLCKLLCTLPDILDKNNSIEYILPLFLLFVRIEETELKSDLFVCLHKISKLISFADMKQIIIPLCSEIMKSKNWRMRYSLYYYLKYFDNFFFITNKDNEETFNSKIFWDLIQEGAKDFVYTVRIVTVETIEFLMQERAFFHFEKGLSVLLHDLKDSTNYLLRITCLQYISKLINYFPLKYIKTEVLSLLDVLSKDNINNVRFNVLKTVFYVSSYLQFVLSIIKKDQYDELLRTVTSILPYTDTGEEPPNTKDKQNYDSKTVNYFRIFEKRNSLPTLEKQIHMSNNYCLTRSFLINASSRSSLSVYDNMKNTESNKKCCEFILTYLLNILNMLCNDPDKETAKASTSLKQDLTQNMRYDVTHVDSNPNQFMLHLNSTISFGELCRPIK